MIEYYGPFKLIKTWIQFFKLIKQTHIPTLVVAIICLVVLIIIKIGINDNKRIMRKLRVPLPAELVIVVFGTLASYEMDLYHNYGVSILKNIPMGLPPPSVPDLRVLPNIIGDTFSNAIVGLAITVTLGKKNKRYRSHVDSRTPVDSSMTKLIVNESQINVKQIWLLEIDASVDSNSILTLSRILKTD